VKKYLVLTLALLAHGSLARKQASPSGSEPLSSGLIEEMRRSLAQMQTRFQKLEQSWQQQIPVAQVPEQPTSGVSMREFGDHVAITVDLNLSEQVARQLQGMVKGSTLRLPLPDGELTVVAEPHREGTQLSYGMAQEKLAVLQSQGDDRVCECASSRFDCSKTCQRRQRRGRTACTCLRECRNCGGLDPQALTRKRLLANRRGKKVVPIKKRVMQSGFESRPIHARLLLRKARIRYDKSEGRLTVIIPKADARRGNGVIVPEICY